MYNENFKKYWNISPIKHKFNICHENNYDLQPYDLPIFLTRIEKGKIIDTKI